MKEYSVLIIDDDVWMQRILSKTLASYGFKKSFLANNGFDGIGKAVEFKPDLIILDILMPELSGHLTLKVIKSIKVIKDIPVIMVSALSDVENLGRAVKSGTAGFISKPFTRATVYEKLLDLYGKEKLDLIQKGMDISEKSNLGYFGDNAFGQLSSSYTEDKDEISGFKMPDFSKETPNYETMSKDSAINPDKLSDRYKDDEKKSIDSIKELLMKTRK
jgi:CheY-like chemotaxis protein